MNEIGVEKRILESATRVRGLLEAYVKKAVLDVWLIDPHHPPDDILRDLNKNTEELFVEIMKLPIEWFEVGSSVARDILVDRIKDRK